MTHKPTHRHTIHARSLRRAFHSEYGMQQAAHVHEYLVSTEACGAIQLMRQFGPSSPELDVARIYFFARGIAEPHRHTQYAPMAISMTHIAATETIELNQQHKKNKRKNSLLARIGSTPFVHTYCQSKVNVSIQHSEHRHRRTREKTTDEYINSKYLLHIELQGTNVLFLFYFDFDGSADRRLAAVFLMLQNRP